MVTEIGREALDLRLTLIDSGQCFLWREEAGVFCGCPGGRPVRLWRDGDTLLGEGADRTFLRALLDLDRDYGLIRKRVEAFPPVARAMDALPGLRVMNQPVWDATVEFILSANNNVPRIRGIVQRLEAHFGGPGLPEQTCLAGATEEELRALGAGYRARYLIGTAQAAEGLEALSGLPYAQAHERLKALPGVGDKVADCILLFGCRHAEAFPVDVWVERAMQARFGLVERDRRRLGEASRQLLGEHAGIMQQFLFHAERVGI